MEFEEKQEYQVEVTESNMVNVRRSDIILKDGIEISKTYHRHVLSPIDDISGQVDKVKKVADAIFTKEVKEKYKSDMIKMIEKEYAERVNQIGLSGMSEDDKTKALDDLKKQREDEIKKYK